MKASGKTWWIGAPLLAVAGYALFVWVWPPSENEWLYRFEGYEKYNPAEWGSAIAFAATAVVGIVLAARARGRLPMVCVLFYATIAMGGFVMAGEELSWGQHLFGFESSEFFKEHNKQGEMNLHNLAGDKPSSLLRRAAEIGFPILFVILPGLHLWLDKKAYTPGHWPYYVLPRFEAMLATILGNLCRPIDKSDRWGPYQVDELAEMLWAMATLFWAISLLRRLSRPENRPELSPQQQ